MVLGLDDSVGSRTLSWHVQFDLAVSKGFLGVGDVEVDRVVEFLDLSRLVDIWIC